MTDIGMPDQLVDLISAVAVMQLLVGAVVGAGIGALHFMALWRSVRGRDGGGPWRFLALAGLRWALTVALLAGLATTGAAALVGGMLGLVAARHIVLHRIGRPS